jgi:hypothetical protein
LIEYPPELNAAGPLHTFTDPDLLAAVFDGLIGMGVPQSRPRIRVDYDRHNRNFCFDLNVGLPAHNGVKGMAHDALAATEFESRAYRAVLSRLGGEVTSDGDAASRRIRIKLPRYPKFDAEKDFCGPIRKTCSVSSAVDQATPGESTAVHFVRCDLRDGGERDFLATESVAMGRLLDYTNSILSDGEAVVRGPRRGSLYIILADRTKDELETISGQLRSAGGDAIVDCEYRAIDARERELKVLAGDLELV